LPFICLRIMTKINSGSPSLYVRLGGRQAVARTVRIFYGKVSRDERISWMFVGSDWQELREHWVNYITVAFGGPSKYDSQLMLDVHCQVNNGKFPEEVHFLAVLENLISVLYDLKVAQEDIDEVVKTVNSFKCYVVGPSKNKVSQQDVNEVPESDLKSVKKWKKLYVYKVVVNAWEKLTNKIFYKKNPKDSTMNLGLVTKDEEITTYCTLKNGASCRFAWSEDIGSSCGFAHSQRSSMKRSPSISVFNQLRDNSSGIWRRSSTTTLRTWLESDESNDCGRSSTSSSWLSDCVMSKEFDTPPMVRLRKCACDAEVAAEAVTKYM